MAPSVEFEDCDERERERCFSSDNCARATVTRGLGLENGWRPIDE